MRLEVGVSGSVQTSTSRYLSGGSEALLLGKHSSWSLAERAQAL